MAVAMEPVEPQAPPRLPVASSSLAIPAGDAGAAAAQLQRRSNQHVAFRSGSEIDRGAADGPGPRQGSSILGEAEVAEGGRPSPRSSQIAVEREDSIMGEVQDRIVRLQILSGTSTTGAPTPASSSRCGGGLTKSPWPSSADSTPGRWTGPLLDEAWELPSRCPLPFRPAVILSVTSVVLLACVLMFLPLESFTQKLQEQTMERYQRSFAAQTNLTESLTQDAARWSYSSVLRSISTTVRIAVMYPPERALEALWGTMRTNRMLDANWKGTTDLQRWGLEYRSFAALVDQYDADVSKPLSLFAAFPGAQFAGAGLTDHFGLWYGFAPDPKGNILQVANLTEDEAEYRCRDIVGCRSFRFETNGTGPALIAFTDTTKLVPSENYTAHVLQMEAFAYDCNGSKVLRATRLAQGTGKRLETVKLMADFNATNRTWYQVQQAMKVRSPRSPGKRLWSKVYNFLHPPGLGLTRTMPILLSCDTYSCMEGVIGADISLDVVSQACRTAWRDFAALLSASAYNFRPDGHNSGVFIVNQDSDYPEEEGLLLGASNDSALEVATVTFANESEDPLVSRTAQAILQRFGSWNDTGLRDQEQVFSYGRYAPELDDCEMPHDETCLQVSTLSVQMEGLRWLVVLVCPVVAFTAPAVTTRSDMLAEFYAMEEHIHDAVDRARFRALLVFVGAALVALLWGLCLGVAVSGPLRRLSGMMKKLSELDFAYVTAECTKLRAGCRTQIREVSDLQDAFCRLSRAIETFSRFVPEAVVRSIVRGDERAARLHVSRRLVTIMFSDIRDFTAISETLRDRDLVFLLTRYLSVMTRLAEEFGGVVAEILGDGLLAFWNTPTDVADHAGKACLAAIAMQQALVRLNAEMQTLGLPTIAVRIGLHTGIVLSGNIGSDQKMKFGCLGDAVNLASRLEGLCKVYGVGIVCSSATFESLRSDHELICRRLDLVQVKGRRDPVLLFEVMGIAPHEPSDQDRADASLDVMSTEGTQAQGCASPRSVALSRAPSVSSSALPAKSPELAAKQAIECSAQSLLESEVVDFDALRKLRRLEQRRGDEAMSPGGTPGSKARSCPAANAKRLRERASRYEAALAAYQAARFVEARDGALALMQDHPADKAATRLLQLASRYVNGDQVANFSEEDRRSWKGVSVMTEK